MSRIGRTRRVNQDRFFTLPIGTDFTTVNRLLGVADGIGGAPGGGEASAIVVETFSRFVREESPALLRADRSDGEILQTLSRGLKRCHAELQAFVGVHPEFSGMGSTVTAGLVLWPRLFVVHLGDSRAYLFRDGELRRLTQDHTYAQALLEAGVLNDSSVRTSSMKYVLSKFLSGDRPEKDSEVHPDVHVELLRPGDTLLFCTDGLTDAVPDEMLTLLLASEPTASEQCRALIGRATGLQARDDATALVARFEMTDAARAVRRKPRAST